MATGLSGAIVAAGHGERLRAASGGVPKPLVEVGGEALLLRQARAMIALGVRSVHVIVNSETARIMGQRALKMPAEVELCVRDTANSMESLLTLGERIAPGRFVLATVDAVLAPDEFRRFVDRAADLTNPAALERLDGALGVVKWRGDRHPLFAEVASGGLIAALGAEKTATVTAGVYLFSTGIFDHAVEARTRRLNAMRQFLGLLVEKGMRFAAIELVEVIDVDEGADLEAAHRMLARHDEAAGTATVGVRSRHRSIT
jgi:NDP-sugar pyrophosphorylase family protein